VREERNPAEVTAFFYGLFMDESLLASQRVSPSQATVGYVEGHGLRSGRRATLVNMLATRPPSSALGRVG